MILYPHVSPFRNFLNFLAANGLSIDGEHLRSIVGHRGDHPTKSPARSAARRKITTGRVLITALTHKIHRYAPPA
jgi:hypothetical protein